MTRGIRWWHRSISSSQCPVCLEDPGSGITSQVRLAPGTPFQAQQVWSLFLDEVGGPEKPLPLLQYDNGGLGIFCTPQQKSLWPSVCGGRAGAAAHAGRVCRCAALPAKAVRSAYGCSAGLLTVGNRACCSSWSTAKRSTWSSAAASPTSCAETQRTEGGLRQPWLRQHQAQVSSCCARNWPEVHTHAKSPPDAWI